MRRFVAIALLLSACSEEPRTVTGNGGADVEPTPEGCSTDADCTAEGSALVCRDGACVEPEPVAPEVRSWELPAGPVGLGTVSALHVQGERILAGGYGTMAVSTDGGATWREATNFPDGRVDQIVSTGTAIFARNIDGVVATSVDGVGWFAPAVALTAFDLQARGDDLYAVGTDAAGTFRVARSGNGGGAWNELRGAEPSQLAIGDGWLVAVERRTSTLKRSDDGGATWNELPDPPTGILSGETIVREWNGAIVALARPFQAFVSLDRGESWRHQVLAVSSNAVTMWLVPSGDGLFAVSDAGQVSRLEAPDGAWSNARTGLASGVRIDAVAGGEDGTFAVVNGSLHRFDAAAGAWELAPSRVVRTAVTDLARDGETIWAVADGRTIHRSDDGGGSWVAVEPPVARLISIRSIAAAEGTVWVGTAWDGIFRSDDGGASWRSLADALPTYIGTAGLQPWGVEDLLYRDGTLYAATSGLASLGGHDGNFVQAGAGVLRSRDGGESWDDDGAGLPTIAGGIPDATTRVIDVGGTLFASTGLHGPHRSTDGGATWQEAGAGWPTIEAVDERAPMLDLVAYDGALWAAADTGSGGLFRSDDGGASWRKVESLPPGPCAAQALAVVDGRLVLGWARTNDWFTTEGVYVLEDGAWVRLGDDPAAPGAIRFLALDDGLLAGTEGNGVWRWAAR